MKYEDLHSRYGAYVSQRLQCELKTSEFESLKIDSLTEWLEVRAESAREEYLRLLSNPLIASEKGTTSTGSACRRWRIAEDLAYLVVIAEDGGAQAQAS
ncbi:MAG: hypothetical protein WC521_00775 [Bdellovibrionales bacterium]|jgi:hypothetical protein